MAYSREEGVSPSHACFTPLLLAIPSPLRAQTWKLCCQGAGLGGTATSTCPKAQA